jgi:hypothetical protein
MQEDPGDDGMLFDGCGDLQGSATVRAMFDVDVEDAFQ